MALVEKGKTVPFKPVRMMQAEECGQFDDFIGIWENFVPEYYCDELIQTFEKIKNEWQGLGVTQMNIEDEYQVWDGSAQFSQKNLGRFDDQILLNYADAKKTAGVNQFLVSCLADYCRVYGQLQGVHLMNSDLKMQKTPPGGGYHVWHYESGSFDTKHRELVWMIYLNDLPDGEGETEFLYQKRRIKPTKGTVVFFPAGLTHVHKGNTVFTTDKYILTGWYVQVA